MNKDRRNRIDKIIKALEDLDDLGELVAEERDAFDNLSEGLQQSDQGQRTEAAADALEEANDMIGGLIAKLEEARDE